MPYVSEYCGFAFMLNSCIDGAAEAPIESEYCGRSFTVNSTIEGVAVAGFSVVEYEYGRLAITENSVIDGAAIVLVESLYNGFPEVVNNVIDGEDAMLSAVNKGNNVPVNFFVGSDMYPCHKAVLPVESDACITTKNVEVPEVPDVADFTFQWKVSTYTALFCLFLIPSADMLTKHS